MRLLAIAALLFVAPLAANGASHHDTTEVARPGSTVITPGGAELVHERDDD